MAEQKKKKTKKISRDPKFWLRVLAGFMCALMLLGTVAMVIEMFRMGSYAAEPMEWHYTEDGSDLLMAVGLMYADGVTVGFETRAEYGFSVGGVGADRRFQPLWELSDSCVSVTCDANLSKSDMTYAITPFANAAVGGWHLESEAGADVSASLAYYGQLAAVQGMYAFPAFINGTVRIRMGSFGSEQEAVGAALNLAESGVNVWVAGPSDTGVSVVNPYTDSILFEYDCGSDSTLALMPRQLGEERVYLVTPAKNTYAGFFKYTRWQDEGVDGVALTNILSMDEYVEGVLPWEVGPSWDQDVLRAFAVAIRSFALTSGKHRTFDVCNLGCCQMYKGNGRTNDNIREAIAATSGLLATYEGKTAKTCYSASMGGTTASSADAWGGSVKYPYLKAVVTPWERYNEYATAHWTVEMTGVQLAEKLAEAEYTGLIGGVTSVRIAELAENSTYVYALELSDAYGNTVTLRKTDTIRTVLGLSSANFVVGRAGDVVERVNYSLEGEEIETLFRPKEQPQAENQLAEEAVRALPVLSGNVCYALSGLEGGLAPVEITESISLLPEMGYIPYNDLTRVHVLTENGEETLDMTVFDSFPVYEELPPPDVSDEDVYTPDLEAANVISTVELLTLEGTPGSFVFVGRGRGHGVGMSQYGAKDLADLGYAYDVILRTYYPGTVLQHFREIYRQQA